MFIEKLPSRTEDAISKSDRHQILNHFLAKVVVDTVQLESGYLHRVIEQVEIN